MSISRITTRLLTKLPKYLGRTSAAGVGGAGFLLAEGLGRAWGYEEDYATARNAAGALLFFAPPGYAVGYLGGKGIVKICEAASKTGVPQAAAGAAASFMKKL